MSAGLNNTKEHKQIIQNYRESVYWNQMKATKGYIKLHPDVWIDLSEIAQICKCNIVEMDAITTWLQKEFPTDFKLKPGFVKYVKEE